MGRRKMEDEGRKKEKKEKVVPKNSGKLRVDEGIHGLISSGEEIL